MRFCGSGLFFEAKCKSILTFKADEFRLLFPLCLSECVAATTLFASRPVKWPSPSRKSGWKRPLLRGPSYEKKRPYIYRNWLQLRLATFGEGGLTPSWVILAFTFRNWRGQTMLFPWESSKKNDFLSSSMALTLFILAFFEGTCGLSVMTLAQLLFQMYQKKESSELSKRKPWHLCNLDSQDGFSCQSVIPFLYFYPRFWALISSRSMVHIRDD